MPRAHLTGAETGRTREETKSQVCHDREVVRKSGIPGMPDGPHSENLKASCALARPVAAAPARFGSPIIDLIAAMNAFVRVVEAGNFTKAADTLDIPNATVTRLIQGLERHLQIRLAAALPLRKWFRRVGGIAFASPAGERHQCLFGCRTGRLGHHSGASVCRARCSGERQTRRRAGRVAAGKRPGPRDLSEQPVPQRNARTTHPRTS